MGLQELRRGRRVVMPRIDGHDRHLAGPQRGRELAPAPASSRTQGAHQVAHRLRITTRPLNAASELGRPLGVHEGARPEADLGAGSGHQRRQRLQAVIMDRARPMGSHIERRARPSRGRRQGQEFPEICEASAESQREPMSANKMWGGRFERGPASIMEEINPSIDFDKRLAGQDLAGSRAHARMLAKQGIIAQADADAILKGLDQIATKSPRAASTSSANWRTSTSTSKRG